MTPIYIFDLDGTLALIEHRRPLVEGPDKDWRGFFAACVDDAPNTPVISVLNLLSDHAEIWVWSGRSDEVIAETVRWLSDNNCHFDGLKMRKAGDHQPDEKLKAGWLDGLEASDRERIVAVFEDRDRMVTLWRSRGLACFQVAPGNF